MNKFSGDDLMQEMPSPKPLFFRKTRMLLPMPAYHMMLYTHRIIIRQIVTNTILRERNEYCS